MNVAYAIDGEIRREMYVGRLHSPVALIRHWVDRNAPQILRVYQVFKGLRWLLLFERVPIDGLAHSHEVDFQDTLFRLNGNAADGLAREKSHCY